MKKEYTIKVVLDNSGTRSSSTSVKADKPDVFTVTVRPTEGASVVDSLAHELGHVIGYIYKTPANTNDIRTGSNPNDRVAMVNKLMAKWGVPPMPMYAETILESEKEAWEFAEKMVDIDPIAKRKLLGSYEEMVRQSREAYELGW